MLEFPIQLEPEDRKIVTVTVTIEETSASTVLVIFKLKLCFAPVAHWHGKVPNAHVCMD